MILLRALLLGALTAHHDTQERSARAVRLTQSSLLKLDIAVSISPLARVASRLAAIARYLAAIATVHEAQRPIPAYRGAQLALAVAVVAVDVLARGEGFGRVFGITYLVEVVAHELPLAIRDDVVEDSVS